MYQNSYLMCMHMCMHMCMRACVCMRVCVCVCAFGCVCMCVCMWIHMYIERLHERRKYDKGRGRGTYSHWGLSVPIVTGGFRAFWRPYMPYRPYMTYTSQERNPSKLINIYHIIMCPHRLLINIYHINKGRGCGRTKT